MKNVSIWLLVSAAAATIVALFMTLDVRGEPPIQTSELPYVAMVEMDCMDVKVKLSKIHETDSLLRVNAGQGYRVVSTKLMSRLHAKIVEDRLDGSALVKKAATFEDALNDFRLDYQTYEVALTELLKMDCADQKQLFYTTLREVRTKRDAVYEDIQQLDQQIKEYRDELQEFKKTLRGQEGANE